mgnify:CR=1 FL=1
MKPSQDGKIYKLHQLIFQTAQYFEILIAFIVIIGLIITLTTVPREMLNLYISGGFNDFLKMTFNIGIELLKMLCRHDLDSVVEVLLFAVARSIIIEHMPILETLIGIIAIAVLFLIRKFLFVSALDKQEND